MDQFDNGRTNHTNGREYELGLVTPTSVVRRTNSVEL